MTKNDYITFEVAKLLDEKGYDEDCSTRYISDGKGRVEFEGWLEGKMHNGKMKDGYLYDSYLAPSLYDMQKWLRNRYNIHIIVETDYNGMYSYKCSNSNDYETAIELDRLIKGNNEIYIYKSYEEALNEGILEALKLI